MMSNPPSSLHQRQRLHRRQNSTPVTFEAMKVQHPAMIQRQNSQHRRGQSIDSRSPIRRQHHHTGSMASITNLGSTSYGQQILREAQQQRLSRPGQHQTYELPVSPQCGTYFPQSNSSLPMSPYDHMTMNAMMQSQSIPAHSQFLPQDFSMPTSAGLQIGYEIDENNHHYFQHNNHMLSHNMGVQMHERRMSHPELRIHTDMRPLTPSQQIQTAHFPLTPAQTPFRAQPLSARAVQPSSLHSFQDDSIKSPYPISMSKSRSLQGIVEQEEPLVGSPGPQISSFEVADIPLPSSYVASPDSVKAQLPEPSKSKKSQHKSKPSQAESLLFFDETGGEQPNLTENPVPVLSADNTTCPLSPTRPALSPRRMSISDLNLEPGISASIEETNVTLDDIAQYIEGPDLADNKWVCRFDDCNKRFGRKENIKSHVQTHLGDRQFRCDHCKKCFVRGHDLKRHAKIHTGTKPYPCLCGNSFARHDALTRHRQRGMCIGAFDGIVKKVIKRGRPRKHRPEMDDRVDKANKTRHSYIEGHDHYTSSASSCSLSSWGSPPTETMDSLSIRDGSPYDEINIFDTDYPSHPARGMTEQFSLPPNMFSFTPPASPGYSTGNKPSPIYRGLSPAELACVSRHETVPELNLPVASMPSRQTIPVLDTDLSNSRNLLASNAMMLQHSQQSLPSLSHSSSSPAADIVAFDFGGDESSFTGMQTMGFNMSTMSGISNMAMIKMDTLPNQDDRNDFDSFLDFEGVDVGLDGTSTDNFFAM